MRISQKALYAVQAVLDLALHPPTQGGVRSADIARRTGVPEKFLEAILLELRRAGLVASKRGPDGGHWLARDPAWVSIGAILEAIDGNLTAPTETGRRDKTPADRCLDALWTRVATSVKDVVDTMTVDELKKQAEPQGRQDFTI
jgi:Rrf2 family protein